MKIKDEMFEIGKIINSANLMKEVRQEVQAFFHNKDNKVMVLKGEYGEKQAQEATDYEIIVVDKEKNEDDMEIISRRIKTNIPDIEVNNLVKGVIGIRKARRGNS